MEESRFKSFLMTFIKEVMEEEEIEEATVTGDVEGYSTPFAFGDSGEGSKKKKRRISTNSTGYKVVKEGIDNQDLVIIRKIIRKEVADILKTIWLKRTSWQ